MAHPTPAPDDDRPPLRAVDDPPHDADAEAAILGAILITAGVDNNAAVQMLAQAPDPADYYRPAHELIAGHLAAAAAVGQPLEPLALKGRLEDAGDLDRAGGAPYLFALVNGVTTAANMQHYADRVRKLASRRRTLENLHRAVAHLELADAEPVDVLASVMDSVETALRFEIAGGNVANDPRLVDGAAFLFDHGPEADPLWGTGDDILWARGESLMIAGPSGVGKTTIAQQVVLAGLGLRNDVLGFPVQPMNRVLYLAADRPEQARRSLARMVGLHNRPQVAGRLVVWKGPPPESVVKSEFVLLNLAKKAKADVVIIDSMKDIAAGIAKDEVGTAMNIALQHLLAEGVDVLALHHVRKSEDRKNPEPTSLDEMYGSSMITNGVGSVLSVWGNAGDLIVKMRHLKQPVGEVGPLTLKHDHKLGLTEIEHGVDILQAVLHTGQHGMSAVGLASLLFPRKDDQRPTKNEVAKARRRLKTLEDQGLIAPGAGDRGRGSEGTRYFVVRRPDDPEETR